MAKDLEIDLLKREIQSYKEEQIRLEKEIRKWKETSDDTLRKEISHLKKTNRHLRSEIEKRDNLIIKTEEILIGLLVKIARDQQLLVGYVDIVTELSDQFVIIGEHRESLKEFIKSLSESEQQLQEDDSSKILLPVENKNTLYDYCSILKLDDEHEWSDIQKRVAGMIIKLFEPCPELTIQYPDFVRLLRTCSRPRISDKSIDSLVKSVTKHDIYREGQVIGIRLKSRDATTAWFDY